MKKFLSIVLAGLALAPAARAGGPGMLVGAAEDVVKQPDPVFAKSQMTLLRLAGLDSVRITTNWTPGQTAVGPNEAALLRNVDTAARLNGIRVFLSVYQPGSKTTPLTDEARAQFAQLAASLARTFPTFRDFVVGNEPNLNRFWLPQFNPDGSDAAAPAYEALLAQVYDALKAVSPRITVIGGAVSPRGQDSPTAARQTHSPTTFIADLGAAYRASGRTKPIMDALAIHPYQDNSSQPPAFQHPSSTTISIADYGKLVALLGKAFDGTAQPGSTLPIVYGEYGVESAIPAEKASFYVGAEPATTKPVDEATQAAYYRQALELAFCQPNVVAFLFFHTVDEPQLPAWQSGLYYADGTPKSDLAAVRDAAIASRRGVLTRCPDLKVTPRALKLAFPTAAALKAGRIAIALTSDVDSAYSARLVRLPEGSTVLAVSGATVGRTPARIAFPSRRLVPGRYRLTLELAAALNPGPPLRVQSRALRVR